MTSTSPTAMTSAQLADQTGVPPGTLRVWTTRYGFPVGDRLPGGHRRYGEADARAVRAVQRLRDQGLSMAAAIAQVQAAVSTPEASIYAALQRRRPDLRPYVMTKAALLQLSRAIEDEHCARAGSGLLLGSFQHERHYRASERRWRELTRTVRCAVALADFSSLNEPEDGPIELPLPRTHQLGREWTLIVDSKEGQAVLSAWEVAEVLAPADHLRRFEVIWSCEPATVADATAVAHSLVKGLSPQVAERIPGGSAARPEAESDLSFGPSVAARAVAYLAANCPGLAGGAATR
jgi:DICT domain-containing protein